LDREQAGLRTREQRLVRQLATVHSFVRTERCPEPRSRLSPLHNATRKARSISRPSVASRWRGLAFAKGAVISSEVEESAPSGGLQEFVVNSLAPENNEDAGEEGNDSGNDTKVKSEGSNQAGENQIDR